MKERSCIYQRNRQLGDESVEHDTSPTTSRSMHATRTPALPIPIRAEWLLLPCICLSHVRLLLVTRPTMACPHEVSFRMDSTSRFLFLVRASPFHFTLFTSPSLRTYALDTLRFVASTFTVLSLPLCDVLAIQTFISALGVLARPLWWRYHDLPFSSCRCTHAFTRKEWLWVRSISTRSYPSGDRLRSKFPRLDVLSTSCLVFFSSPPFLVASSHHP